LVPSQKQTGTIAVCGPRIMLNSVAEQKDLPVQRNNDWQKNGWQKNEVGADVSSNPKQRLDRLIIFLPPIFLPVILMPKVFLSFRSAMFPLSCYGADSCTIRPLRVCDP